MSNEHKISVIIPTLNRPEALSETLTSYAQGIVIPDEIIIVDQTSDAKLKESISKIVLENSKVLNIKHCFQSAPSLTKARNTGYRLSTGEYLIFSDDDISVKKETLQNICHIFEDKTVSMIAGIDLNNSPKHGSMIGYLFGRKSFSKRKIGHVTKAIYGRFPSIESCHKTETEWAMGYFFCVRKHLMKKWNIKWDENLINYAYAEDLSFSYEYYLKSKKENLRCIMDDSVSVWHRFSQEYRIPSKKATMMLVINREYISYRFFGNLSRIATRWSNFGEFLFRVVKRSRPMDLLLAQIVCDKHRKMIKKGIIKPEWYN